ncbi:IS110 family transposase, partial [Brevibacillus sp. NRS-1366]|uniref:IS110 family transposase n=1 Tax=Brevibacillus sp. NRS-1366 TaxID=3233899 RepID=UPI003D1D584A
MKFKRSDAQNQRIERITTEHLVVGIDIAKETHVARTVNYRGLELGCHLTFSNSHDGFEKLLRWIQSLQSQQALSQLIIGLEPTGHYWFSLADWLVSRDVDIVLVNPLTTKRNKENRDNSQSKNDVKDALVIADLVCRGYYSSYTQHAPIYQRLRMVMNEREYWSKQKTSINNRVIRWLDLYFPEYTSVFKEWDCPRSMATLKEFPLPSDLRDLNTQQVIAGWKKHMQRSGGGRGFKKAGQLLNKAHHTVSVKVGQEEARRELKRLLDEYERLSGLLEEIEQEVLVLLKEIPDVVELLQSIKGLSPLMIAAILAGTGDLRKYADGRQVLSRAGLNLAEDSSGKHKG